MKIVVLDGHALSPNSAGWDPLKDFGEIIVYPRLPEADVRAAAMDADILITNKVILSARLIENLPALKFIAVSATGVNCVDTVAARGRRIPVSNVPEYGTHSVAQFTIALLLELCHRVGLHADSVQSGEWTRSADFCFWKTTQVELAGKTMGIVGMGRIGRRVAAVACALGMNVIYFSPSHTNRLAEDPQVTFCPLNQLLETADVVSLHCPLAPTTEGLMNRARLATMKPTAFLINTSRGALVIEEDLAAALNARQIAGAAVDVASREPIAADNPLLSATNCLITPHIAWTTTEARRRLLQTTIDNVTHFIAGHPIHVVNFAN